MSRNFVAASAACFTLLFPFVATAASIAGSASVGNVQFSVVDLTPNDGQAAGFQLGERSNFYEGRYGLSSGPADEYRLEPTLPVPVHGALHYGAYYTKADSDGSLGNVAATLGGELAPWETSTAVSAQASHGQTILLKAHSALTITGQAQAEWSRTGALPSTIDLSYANSRVYAILDYISLQQPSQRFDWDVGLGTNASVSDTTVFALTASNPYDYDIELRLDVGSSTAFNTVLLVPEPSTWLMFAGGLLAVAGCVRHKRHGVARKAI